MLTLLQDASLGHSCAYKKSLKVPHSIHTISISHSCRYAIQILRGLGASHILPSTSPKGDYHCDCWMEFVRLQRKQKTFHWTTA